jgi:hypothetical protein
MASESRAIAGEVDSLAARLHGSLIRPEDPPYHDARVLYNAMIDKRPALIARCAGARMPTWKSTMHLYPIDGAAHRVGPTETAWGYRNANWGMVMAGVDPDPANVDAISSWSKSYWEALHPFPAGGAYVNMMMEEGQERVEASYGESYERLARIKATYDPDNVFHVNQNIPPAG